MHRNIQCLRVTRVDYDDYGDHHANHGGDHYGDTDFATDQQEESSRWG